MLATRPTLTPPATPTAAIPAAVSPVSCAPKLYDIPANHPACAMPKSSAYKTIMSTCCGAAPVLPNSECSYYCLALGQTVNDLAHCLIDGSKDRHGQVWCNAYTNTDAAEAEDVSITLSPSLVLTDSNPESSAEATETDPMDEELADLAIINGVREQPVSVTNALLLLLMVLGGVMRIAP
ncbi:uncharacterized protein BDV14DRAFT_199413 [Aspergillus stella-maris]|uniref:uncharacterized protein n=1 Tax=Aspergillus stella-maris TaxID=1810926 RepID=UPI003CCC9FF2